MKDLLYACRLTKQAFATVFEGRYTRFLGSASSYYPNPKGKSATNKDAEKVIVGGIQELFRRDLNTQALALMPAPGDEALQPN